MLRQLATVLMLVGLALTLSACDKCGGFQEIRYPHVCKGGPSH